VRYILPLVLLLSACYQQRRIPLQHMTEPEYPVKARFERIYGTVKVEISIDAEGRVSSAKGTGDHVILIEAAEADIRQWRFGRVRRTTKPRGVRPRGLA